MIFPNPAKSNAVLRISGNKGEVDIAVADMSGKILWRSLKVNEQQVNIPLEKFANGVYLVTINNGKEIKVLKLIKE